MGTEALIVFIVLLAGYVILAVALAVERDKGSRLEARLANATAEASIKQLRVERLEAMLRERDPFIVRLQSLQDRGWRVLLKSHAFIERDDQGRTVRKDAWGWNVSVVPIDRHRYARWEALTGAVMATLEDAMGDTEQRVSRIEAIERDEAIQRETNPAGMTNAEMQARFG